MDEEFVSVEDDLPLDDPDFEYLSIEVDLLLSDGSIIRNCFYHNSTEKWYRSIGLMPIKKKVIGWRTSK